MNNTTRKTEEFINKTYDNISSTDKVKVIDGNRYGGYLWLDCQCCSCGERFEIRHSNLEGGKFVCPTCHPDRQFAFCKIGDSQPFRFNIIQQNNTSGFVGVDYVKKEKKWRARLNYNKHCYNIGLYNTPEEAHEARERKRRELGLININKFTQEKEDEK